MAILRPFGGKTPAVHETAFLAEGAVVLGDVQIAAHASVWFGCVLRGDVNSIRIGARTNIQDLSVVHVTSKTHPTVIGDEVTVGHRVVLHGCTIKDRCLVGIGSVVLDGAVVGPESVIGAGALVPPGMVVPPRTLVMGSPAKVKRDLSVEEIEALRRSADNYVEYAARYVAEGWVRG
jgi:carbonic anhydrase/acetyltransferase-like protein (isoleucine patch superfamily)